MCPNQGFNQLLPIAPPGDQEHKARRPDQVAEQEHPGPDRQVVHTVGVVAVDELRAIQPQIIAEPAHEVGGVFVELGDITAPEGEMLPVPVEG